MIIALLVVLMGLALVVAACFVRGAKRDAAPPAPRVSRVRGPLTDGFCPWCGEAGIYLNRDGRPNRRYHHCPVTLGGTASASNPKEGA